MEAFVSRCNVMRGPCRQARQANRVQTSPRSRHHPRKLTGSQPEAERLGSLRRRPLRSYVYFDRRARYGADAEDLEGGAGGGLLALFYGGALAGGDLASIDGDAGDKARTVGRALLGDDAVGRAEAVGLEGLLEERLPVPALRSEERRV